VVTTQGHFGHGCVVVLVCDNWPVNCGPQFSLLFVCLFDATSLISWEIHHWILVIVFPAVRACDADFLSSKIINGQRFVSILCTLCLRGVMFGPSVGGYAILQFLPLLTFQVIFRHIWSSEKQKNSCFLNKFLDHNNVQYVFVNSFNKCCFFFFLEFSICRVYFQFMHFIVLALCLWMFLSFCSWSVLWH
jgi:hypothetical protein